MLTELKSALVRLIDPPRELWKRAINHIKGVRDINVHQAQVLISEGAFVLDVREPHEYAAGHVPASTLIPVANLKDRLAEIETHRNCKIVVICHGGKRSATACEQLAKVGFAQTYNIAGGILAWKKARLAVVQ